MSGLRTENLSVQFGAVKPVDGVSVEIAAGKLTSIIGPNGAGKTSFFNLLTGLYLPTRGKVYFDGNDVTDMPVHQKVRCGLTRTFQILNVFDALTVEENIRVAVQRRHGRSRKLFCAADVHGPVEDEVAEITERIRLPDKRKVRACDLSHGHRRHLEIGLSLATRPKTLLLDEPMSGLGMYESSIMGEFVRELAQSLTVVLVEHHMSVVLSISDTILVLSQGRLLASGTPAEIQANPAVQEAYLGSGRYDLPQERAAHA
ncbi:ABC transporter ATP-binding protein [Rhodopseudomonas pseudopalustris]|uniref:ABC transporter related n=2 Tax=Rhodopseudomonas TaxID=1073 RepID=Q13F48_RHOPS|nr:ABC transporter ATP-binding protein [Rhodopseudomonas pseudopalustris]ABE37291.1 ABC transporter related [Rhodopseudomonas palustris BisB5]MBB1090403.1 ABC transporter ATP-binding protein [Rhodopseudomonas palustris]SEO13361.1 amino acid/amide ABC transporter ATP-binding protein 1, HAAT family [Rhodopseudomonas pseudopalustris]